MGVDRTDYIVYGWKLPANYFETKGIDIWGDKFLRYIEGWEGEKYTIIKDGMCGKYCVFGLMITQANEEGFEFFEITNDSLSPIELTDKFKEVFGFTDESIGYPKHLVFTHWS